MGIISLFFNEILYKPIFNLLVAFYNLLPGHDFGVSIILVTLLIRILLLPLSLKAVRSQKALQALQPKIKEIQQKHKDDKEKQTKEMLSLWREHKVNPFSGFLIILVQLPILIALYKVFLTAFDLEKLNNLYSFVSHPGNINPLFLGIVNLSQASKTLAVLAGISQFFYSKLMTKISSSGPGAAEKQQFSAISKNLMFFMPIFTIFIAWNLPAGLPLYWLVITVFGIAEQIFIKSKVSR